MKLKLNASSFRYSLGSRGEDVAEQYLISKGYQVFERNYKCKIGEIDRVVRKDGRYYFIEVKTRRSHAFGSPQESVTRRKQIKLIKLAQWYLKQHHLEDALVSFGVVAVTWPHQKRPQIEFLENAFEGGSLNDE